MCSRKPRVFTALVLVTAIAAGLISATPASANPKYASLVIDGFTGTEVRARNADSQRYPASLTKIMTLYVLFSEIEGGRIAKTDRITFSAHAAAQPPSKLGLKAGESITVDNAIRALVTKSANDVAAAIAEHISGTERKFAERMTSTARALGMSRTTFRNASGLPNDEQRTTARDMATLGLRIMTDFPEHYKLFATESFTFNGQTFRNHNRLLGNYAGTEGIKTGYINASGYNLVASVRRGDKLLIGVVMGGKSGSSRDAHMREILDESFPKAVAYTGPAPRGKPVMVAAATPAPVAEAAPAPTPQANPEPVAAAAAPAKIEVGVVRLAMMEIPPVSRELPLAEPVARDPMQMAAAGAPMIAPQLARAAVLRQPVEIAMSAYQASAVPGAIAEAAPAYEATPPEAAAYAASDESVPEDPIERLIAAAMANPAMAIEGVPAVRPGRLIRPDGTAETGVVEVAYAAPDAIEIPAGYQIQVGAYASRALAEERLERAKETAKDLLAQAMGITPTVEKDSETFYRARFAGLDKDDAQRACKTLKQSKIDCIVVSE